jgi:ubiquinone/menaquinone biosynthesis C-methylase UbiE
MKFYYPDNYYSLVSEKINLFERIYYELFRRIPYNSKGKILDIGCGNGKFMYFIKEKGYDVDGHDVFLVPDYVKKDFNIYEGELYNAGIKNDIYDVITMWWSIEHMRNPLRILQECYRILKIGGHIIIATSNINSLEAAIFKKYWHHLLVPEHCIQFTDKTLSEMIKKAGFSDIKVRYDLFSFGFLSSLCLYLKGKNIKVNSAGILVRAFSFLFLPLDILFSLLKRSALITVYAKKKFTY